MEQTLEINNISLILSTTLLVIAIFISYKEQLGLNKDIIIAGIRAVIQLFIIGYILEYIFAVDHTFLTLAMVVFIILNVSYKSSQRSSNISNSFMILIVVIVIGLVVTVIMLILLVVI